jgi:hypothetical protein
MEIADAPRAGRVAADRLAAALLLTAAFASFALSVALWFTGNRLEGVFVGIWVPSILSFGTFVHVVRTGR